MSLAIGVAEADDWLELVLPAALSYFWMLLLPGSAAVHAYREASRSRSWPVAAVRVAAVAVALALAVAVFSVTARPMTAIVRSRAGSRAAVAALPSLGAETDDRLLLVASKLHVSSGYGLFRRMTGVGTIFKEQSRGDRAHRVARPEIILQGSADGRKWKDLAFRHKPGDPTSPPTWVAPHQPRLVGWTDFLTEWSRDWSTDWTGDWLTGHPRIYTCTCPLTSYMYIINIIVEVP